jgi:cysteine desulfurase
MASKQYTIFLDNNASSLMPERVIQSMVRWCNKGNPSAKYSSAAEAKAMIRDFKNIIISELSCDVGDPYKVMITSGASESNSFILNSVTRAYSAALSILPHIIISDLEHKSVMECAQRMEVERLCQLTIVPTEKIPGPTFGTVTAANLEEALRKNTCLISIIAANGEIGTINNLSELSRVARSSNIPFHSDVTQLFGKSPINVPALGLDAISTSFHKMGGPPGVGVLIVRKKLIDGYGMLAQITGDQNEGFRGGTENVPGIGAALAAFKIAMRDRYDKTLQMQALRNSFVAFLERALPCFSIKDYEPPEPVSIDGGISKPPIQAWAVSADVKKIMKSKKPVILWVTSNDKRTLPNTLAFYVTNISTEVIRAELEQKNIIVSTTNTTMVIMKINPKLKGSYLRISISDSTTAEDIETAANALVEAITRQRD